jgi:hypothetical protein
MTIPAIIQDDRKFIVTSHSIDGTFESCPKRFMFRHVYQEKPLNEGSGLAADVGTALHEAAQEFTRSKSYEKAAMTLLRWWPWALERKREERGLKDHKRTLGNSLLLLERICNDPFWDDWEVATLPDGTPAIELAWRINHTSLGSFLHPYTKEEVYLATQGKIDWILRHKRDRNKFRICDLKTTIMGEEAQQASFRFSGQGGQYGLVLAHALGMPWEQEGIEVTYLVAEFGEHGAAEVNAFNYHLSPEEVMESIEAKNERLRRMMYMGSTGFWPRRSHGCSFYQTPCGFLDVCHRSEPKFLWQWFEDSRENFAKEARIYEPFWTIEA